MSPLLAPPIRRSFRSIATSLLTLLAVALLPRPAESAPAGPYQLQDLGPLGGAAPKALALNATAGVAGSRLVPAPGNPHFTRAFLHKGKFEDLGTAAHATFGSDLNDRGDVVGWSQMIQPGGRRTDRALLFQQGNLIELGAFGGANSRAYGLNGRSEVTGAAQTTNGAFHAFLYRSGKLEDLGTLGGRHSYGHAVNSALEVAGVSETAQQSRHAFLYSAGKLRDLGTLGGGYSQANGLNEAGDVVGMTQNAQGQSRAFLYTKGKMSDLGTLGGLSSFAHALNDTQEIVGLAQTRAGENHAFLWRKGTITDLNQLLAPNSGWYLLEATDINESGQIVAVARTKAGQLRAVLLSPPGMKPRPLP